MKTDDRLISEVQAQIAADPALSSRAIAVAARQGVVTLRGAVGDLEERQAAGRAALRVEGVRGVAVELVSGRPDRRRCADTDIVSAAKQALDRSVLVPRGAIQVTVDGGHVTLDGIVAWHYQRDAAERAVRDLCAAGDLTNGVAVIPAVNLQVVRHRVEEALEARGDCGVDGVTVSVDGTSVKLAGRLRSRAGRDALMRAARTAPGVTDIVDEIVVAEAAPELR